MSCGVAGTIVGADQKLTKDQVQVLKLSMTMVAENLESGSYDVLSHLVL